MRIDNQELLKQLKEWSDDGENAKIVSAARLLPKSGLDDEILTIIADAYIEEKRYKKAVNILEGQRERLDGDYHWHFRLGMALYLAVQNNESDEEVRRGVLEKAQISFARCMNLNPPENVMDEAGRFLDLIEDEFDEMEDEEEIEDDECDDCEMYDEDELDVIEDHIEEYFGDFPTIFHEIRSSDIHCDIYIVPPTEKRDYYTLITVGMGAHIMNVPETLDPEENGRAELMICLPKNWKIGESAEEWFWPISLLKNLSRLPINCETWLGWGHSVDNKDVFSKTTKLCGSLLVYPEEIDKGADTCRLPNGDIVNFFEVIPLYREEMDFKIDNDTHALLEKLNVSHIVDINRENVCDGYVKRGLIDAAHTHSDKITEKNLPLALINGCNHIAIFLRWCIEHDLYSKYYFEKFPGVVESVKNKTPIDLRRFLLGCAYGEFNSNCLCFLGYMFTRRYYDWNNRFDDCFFPRDVDKCAEEYFGTEKYNCEEFKDEAYLFVPFDEEYYKKLSAYIDRAYDIFLPEYLTYNYDRARPLLRKAKKLLGCKFDFPKDQREIPHIMQKSFEKTGEMPLVFILDKEDDNSQTSAEVLERVLYDCDEPFWLPTAIALEEKEFVRGLDREKAEEISNEAITENAKAAEKYFGAMPAVLEIYENSADLMLPKADGKYLLWKGICNDG